MNTTTPILLTEETACETPPSCATSASEPLSNPCEGAQAALAMSGDLKTSKSSWGGARANSGGPRPNSGRPRIHPAPEPHRLIQRQPLGLRWYAIEIFSRDRERITRDILEGESRRGHMPRPPFGFYLPMQVVEKIGPDGKPMRDQANKLIERTVPCYVGYAFVEFDRDRDPWGTIAQVDGVRSIIGTRTGIPVPLSPDWHERELKEEPKRMRLPEVAQEPFGKGAALTLNGGALDGLPCVCVSCTGRTTVIEVLVFNRVVEMTVPRSGVRTAAPT